MLNDILRQEIRSHAIKERPHEACGLVITAGGSERVFPCRNTAKSPADSFEINTTDYVKASMNSDIIAIYHSHPGENDAFSPLSDKVISFAHQIPLVLYHISTDSFKIFDPSKEEFKEQKYLNREFRRGSSDCFSLVKDFYAHELDLWFVDKIRDKYKSSGKVFVELVNVLYEDNQHFLMEISYIKGETLKPYDILIGKNDMGQNHFPYHIMLYLGDGNILHQPFFNTSRIDKLTEELQNEIFRVFRRKNE